MCVCGWGVGGGGSEREMSEIVPSTDAFHFIFTNYSMDLVDSVERDYMRCGMGLMMCSHCCNATPHYSALPR